MEISSGEYHSYPFSLLPHLLRLSWLYLCISLISLSSLYVSILFSPTPLKKDFVRVSYSSYEGSSSCISTSFLLLISVSFLLSISPLKLNYSSVFLFSLSLSSLYVAIWWHALPQCAVNEACMHVCMYVCGNWR